jgi:hypothetical protein
MRGRVLKTILTPSRRVEQRIRREKIEKDDWRTEERSAAFIDRGPIGKVKKAYVRCCSAAIVSALVIHLIPDRPQSSIPCSDSHHLYKIIYS